MRTHLRVLVLAAACTAAWSARAADPAIYSTVTPLAGFDADSYAGSQFREQVGHVNSTSGGTLAIMAALQPALDFCDTRTAMPGSVHVSVSTGAEARAFAASQPSGTKIDYIDIACPRAYYAAAFAMTDAGDAAKADAFLDRAQALAPYWAEPYTEHGFLFNAHGDRTRALAFYRHALELAQTWPSSQRSAEVALRGIGWTLVEQGDFAGAREAYRHSLELAPGNTLALNELAYIDQNEKKGSPNTPIFDTTVQQDESSLARRRFTIETKWLEANPLAGDAPDIRKRLLKWLDESKDVTVVVCDVLQLGNGQQHAEPELLGQYMFGNAALQIDRPDLKDNAVAVQLAGVRSALRAYRSLVAQRPELRLDAMEQLLRHEEAGGLQAFLAPIIARRCSVQKDAKPKSPGGGLDHNAG